MTAVLVPGLLAFFLVLIVQRQLLQSVEATLIDMSIVAVLKAFTILMKSAFRMNVSLRAARSKRSPRHHVITVSECDA